MSGEEKILLIISGIALVAVLVFKVPKPVEELVSAPESQPIDAETAKGGPAYLTYNQPFIWGPPVQPFLPAINATSSGGTAVNSGLTYDDSCGCWV